MRTPKKTKQKKDKYSNVSTLKKVVVMLGYFTALFGGMFAAIIAVDNYKNYIHPYSFTFLFGAVGMIAGLYIAKLIKPYVILNSTMLFNYDILKMPFSMGFAGSFMLLGYFLNTAISSQVKCDEFTVVEIDYKKGGYKYAEQNIINVDIDGKTEKFLCRSDYWKSISIGGKVKVCIYNSPIGFDNLVLTEDL
jgi:hypothetical protein